MSMMIGGAFSRGLVSIRVTPSIGVRISSSAGSDIGPVLLCGWNLLRGSRFGCWIGEKWCKRRDFVSGTFDTDHGGAVDGQRRSHRGGEAVEVGDVDRLQPREHGCQAGTQTAGTESVVAVKVVIEQ